MDVQHLTVGNVIAELLPDGTGDLNNPSWDDCPMWPPDTFAVCATLAKLSGCYAEPGLILSRNDSERAQKKARAKKAIKEGKLWAVHERPPPHVEKLWKRLINASSQHVCAGEGQGEGWKKAALQLIAIADETCSGVGYEPTEKPGSYNIAEFVLEQLSEFQRQQTSVLRLPYTLTYLVPPGVCCVLPKAMTPEVGCTLRSLSHHLALLPGVGAVRTEWYLGESLPKKAEQLCPKSLNLLLIPFPFVVRASDFVAARQPKKDVDGYFAINQGWLRYGTKDLTASQIAKFVLNLIASAEQEAKPVQGVIFPEAALTRQLAVGVARIILNKRPELEFVICGAMHTEKGATRNEAIIFRMTDGDLVSFTQSKHHRWRLDSPQIIQYHLGSSLNPDFKWWEQIDVHDRALQLSVDAHEAVIAALVCEDLARHEPVLPVISAIGPSLVVALLMDGPQLETRWSARYATVLAEDPGSSVLTLTCAGMIRRSRKAGASTDLVIGIWKDREGRAKELTMPDRDHGLLLCLTSKTAEQRTIDSRSDGGNLVEYRLSGVQPVAVKNPPPWLERAR